MDLGETVGNFCFLQRPQHLQATIPKHASVTWRAIIHGRKALNSGLIKRIGNGTTVNIWTDKWIPNTIRMSPVARLGNAQINTVLDIIDADNWTWKSEVIRETFIPPDAYATLNIPLRRGGG